jgi:hypothetical protein
MRASFDRSASRSVVSTSSDSVRALELDQMVTRKDWEGVVMAAAQLKSSFSVEERGGNAGEGLGWCLARYRGLEGVAWRSTAAGVVAGLALTKRGPRIGEAVGRDARAVLREGRREEGEIS